MVKQGKKHASDVRQVLDWLERRGTKRNRDGMARYGIVAPKVYGVSVAALRKLAKEIGRDHELALALWESGWYEARMLTAFIDDPTLVTPAQMDRWAREFDNWAICDTLCFHLFDKTPYAWRKVEQWSKRRGEFVKRAAFALLAAMAVHHKRSSDEQFLESLAIIEAGAADERNFVKKGVSWALRTVARRSGRLHDQSLVLARRLAESSNAAARWVGKDALRDLSRVRVKQRPVVRREKPREIAV